MKMNTGCQLEGVGGDQKTRRQKIARRKQANMSIMNILEVDRPSENFRRVQTENDFVENSGNEALTGRLGKAA
jgi:hypothetical protein